MRALTKGQNNSSGSLPTAQARGWQRYLPETTDDELADINLHETITALHQAEVVIRAQEERIRHLEEMAMTDELTGLANRRGFTAAFERELALTRRDTNYSGILVMIDLDGFKTINDSWGHQAGDAYLCTVAQVLREGLRASDTVARLGGDEFALLLTHMDETNGAKRLSRLKEAFCQRAMMLSERIPLRASFGFAAYAGSDNAEAVMHTADLRLYAHKARNKTLVTAD